MKKLNKYLQLQVHSYTIVAMDRILKFTICS